MLAAGEVKTGMDFYDAGQIFQHGQTPDDYLFAHILAVEALSKGYEASKWMAMATLDRYLQAIGRAQVFGTQYPLDTSLPTPASLYPHAMRISGRTQAPFDRTLVPDRMRHDFCVPDLAQQQANVAEFNANRIPRSTMVVPGCIRQ
jgi:hypothetical protein